MKAKINNIEFEGTPEEFAEFLRLQTEKVECSEKEEDIINVPRQAAKSCFGRKKHKGAAVISVLHFGEPVGTMNLSELASLLGCNRHQLKYQFERSNKIEVNGYTATMIERGKPRAAVRLKATDTKGDNRIYNSIVEFCAKTNISISSFRWLRLNQPKGPWQINGYTVEKIN